MLQCHASAIHLHILAKNQGINKLSDPLPFCSPMAMEREKILTIKPEFLCDILVKEKQWEIRKTNTLYRGMVAFAASGTFKLWGVAQLVDATWMSRRELSTEEALQAHRLTEKQVRTYGSTGGAWVWKFQGAQALQNPVPWTPKRGAIIWHTTTEDITHALAASDRLRNPDSTALHDAMHKAVMDVRKEKKNEEAVQRKQRKRKRGLE